MNIKKKILWTIRIAFTLMFSITIISLLSYTLLDHRLYFFDRSYMIHERQDILSVPTAIIVIILVLRSTERLFYTNQTKQILNIGIALSILTSLAFVAATLFDYSFYEQTGKIQFARVNPIEIVLGSLFNNFITVGYVFIFIKLFISKNLKLKEENELTV